jgi:hypothetical protein
MMTNTLRALATALLLSTVTATTAVMMVSPAAAATVRPQVGAALNAAIKDAAAGNSSAANEKIHEAESVGSLTSSEQQAIEQTKSYVAAKTGNFAGGGGSATAAKAKFANDYNAGRYSAVVGEDADLLRKYNALDGQSQVIIAQAYYLMHDYQQCMHAVRDAGRGSQSTLELLSRCAFEAGDQAVVQSTLEQLVVDFNQSKYWSDLLDSAEQTPGISNPDTLDVFRIRLLTNTMKGASDYQTAAEIAIQLGFPTEGAALVQKGMDLKLIDASRGSRLLTLAKSAAAADVASLPKTSAAAAAAKTGDAQVKLGEDYWGMGRYQDAVDAIKAGIAKGASNPDEAQIRLAMAYVGLHSRDSAVHALGQVSKSAPAHTLAIAKLWSIYARTH